MKNTWIEEELEERKLPPLLQMKNGLPVCTSKDWEKRRAEIGEILSREFVGYPTRLSFDVGTQVERKEEKGYGGKAVVEYRSLTVRSDYSEGSFPFTLALPRGREKVPLFVYLAFSANPADGIGEEILDAGYGIASVYYQDIAADYFDEHSTGLGRFCTRNPFDSWGKLRIWAWAAGRMVDVLAQDERIDPARIAVMGHSRLGKTALVAGAFDERFSLTVSCQSGGGGAALFRGKTGEQMENLYGKGSRLWFDGYFFDYLGHTAKLPFDQHFLLAMAAPRHLYVSSAAEDAWADPKSEFLACAAASQAYELLGVPGLEGADAFPEVGKAFHEGHIGYHLRKGTHYLSREDWQQVIAYRERHGV